MIRVRKPPSYKSPIIDMKKDTNGIWRAHPVDTYVTESNALSYMEDQETGIRIYFIDELAQVDWESLVDALDGKKGKEKDADHRHHRLPPKR